MDIYNIIIIILLILIMARIGNKRQVWMGQADRTSGGLKKSDLAQNKSGKIVSKKKQEAGKKLFAKNGLKPKTKKELEELRNKKK